MKGVGCRVVKGLRGFYILFFIVFKFLGGSGLFREGIYSWIGEFRRGIWFSLEDLEVFWRRCYFC